MQGTRLKETHMTRRLLLIAAVATTALPAAFAQDMERRVPVTFDAGSSGRSFNDTISDFEAVTYVVTLRQGQSLHVQLATSNISNCFDIHAPGKARPIYFGGDSGNTHQLLAEVSGEYLVRVYLLRLAARDGQSAQYTLELKVAG